MKTMLATVILLASTALAGVPGRQAGESIYNGTVDLRCDGWSAYMTGSHVLDRDNTGSGQEQLQIDITDGDGTLIYTETFSNALGNYLNGIGSGMYTTAPTANPITFTLTSVAGNSLPEQVDFVAQGTCDALVAPAGEIPALDAGGLVVLALGLTSAAVLVLRRF